jgi:hypothetical protein
MMKYLLTMKEMKKIFKNTLYLLIVLITFSACQSVKDGLSGKKKSNSDEFLVEKKNPLVLPPEFEKLPEPETLIKKKDNEISLKEILTKNNTIINTKSISETSSRSLEKSILEKINNN